MTLTSQIATNRGPFGDGTATGIGTGIVLTADGYALTNRHVVEGSQSLKATMADGTEYPASVVKISDTQDLALVKIDATGLKPATIGNSDAIQVGQTAIAIGSPLGTFTETVTKGIVSALDRSITGPGRADGPPGHAQRPHPDRRGDQPRQQRRAAPQRERRGRRRQHRDRVDAPRASASRSRSRKRRA